jgi:hypothetical protein
MATPSWWNPYSIGQYNEVGSPIELMNLLLPLMAPYQQGQMGQYLYSQRAGDTDWSNLFAGYNQNQPVGTAQDWLKNAGAGVPGGIPSYLQNSPDVNWLQGLMSAGAGLTPTMTHGQQRQFKNSYEDIMAQAPNNQMASLGAALYNPTLQNAQFGSAAGIGTYLNKPLIKGGLVANPYYTG